MDWGSPALESQPARTGTSKRTPSHLHFHWRLAWVVALLLGGLTAGVVIAAGSDWPAWAGTRPMNISESVWEEAWQPVVATGSSGRIVVAWSNYDEMGAERNIYAVLSNDNGRTWITSSQVISATARDSVLPDALVAQDRRFVAWVDRAGGGQPGALYEAEIAEAGTVAIRSIASPLTIADTQPRLAAGADDLYVVFNGGDPSRILYAARSLTSTAWPTATVVYTPAVDFEMGSLFPTLAIDPDGETLHLAWRDYGLNVHAIRYMRWETGGTYTDTLSQKAPAGTTWGRPSIAVDPAGNLHAVWEEEVGTGHPESRDRYVRYTRYDVNSGSWISPAVRLYPHPVRVNADDPRNIVPALTLVEKEGVVTVCVAWHGFRASGPEVGAEEIVLSCSQNGGLSWPALPQNMSRSPTAEEVSIMPSITFDALGQLHGVWQERSQFPYYEIYYAYSLDNQIFLPLVLRNG